MIPSNRGEGASPESFETTEPLEPSQSSERADRSGLLEIESEIELTQAANAFLQSIVDTVREPMLVLDQELRVVAASRSFCRHFQVRPQDTEGRRVYELGNGQWNIPDLRRLLEDILPSNTHFDEFEVRHEFPHIGSRTMLLNARKLYRPGNQVRMLLLAFEDVTERRAAETERDAAHRALQAAFERERHIAQALQKPLNLAVPEDAFPGLAVATGYEPASSEADVGGDFFDLFALPRGLGALAIADASGKGLQAAVRALQVKDVLRAFCREYPHAVNQVMARLNDFVCDTNTLDITGSTRAHEGFVCIALAILNPETGEGSIVSAGTEPPAILRADGTVETIEEHGLPLGLEREMLYQAAPLRLQRGDTLLMVTDGITEARQTATRALLGYEGMLALAQAPARNAPNSEGAGGSLRQIGESIFAGAKTFTGGRLHDDACLLLARRA